MFLCTRPQSLYNLPVCVGWDVTRYSQSLKVVSRSSRQVKGKTHLFPQLFAIFGSFALANDLSVKDFAFPDDYVTVVDSVVTFPCTWFFLLSLPLHTMNFTS